MFYNACMLNEAQPFPFHGKRLRGDIDLTLEIDHYKIANVMNGQHDLKEFFGFIGK